MNASIPQQAVKMKLFLVGLFLILCTTASYATKSKKHKFVCDYYYVSVPKTVIRDQASKRGHVKLTLYKHEAVWVIEDIGNYYFVQSVDHKVEGFTPKWALTDSIPKISPKSSRLFYNAPPALDIGKMIAITNTYGQWYKVKESGGYVSIKDFAINNGMSYSCQAAIDGHIIKPGKGPVFVNIVISFYDADEKPLGTQTVMISNVDRDGGLYSLESTSGTISLESATYISATLGDIYGFKQR